MKSTGIRTALAALAVALIAACGTPPAVNRAPRTVAHIVSGDVVSYSSASYGARVSMVELDGMPVAEPYGPVELKPGQHIVSLKCDSTTKSYAIAATAGQVYLFVTRSAPDVKGCIPALVRVRSTNP